jgi:hypothetical protein
MPPNAPTDTPVKDKAAEAKAKIEALVKNPWKVRLTHPNHNDRIVFRSISERRARAWLANHYPTGSEAYLESPDGTKQSYERNRQGDYGQDADEWADFDPTTWIPTDQAPPPGETAWADKEG